MMPHEEIEALETTIQRWESFVHHGQEVLRSLEAAVGSMKEATLQYPGTSAKATLPAKKKAPARKKARKGASASETGTELRARARIAEQQQRVDDGGRSSA